MPVEIGEVTSTVRAVDGESLLSAPMLARLVEAVARALKDRDGRDQRAKAERAITGGVSAERDEE